MKKLIKMILMILLSSILFYSYALPVVEVNAAGSGDETDSSTSAAILSGINVTGSDTDVSQLKAVVGRILGLMRIAAGLATVVLVAVFGFKFILGSPEGKADYMKSFVPLIVGCIVVFSALWIADLIFSISTVA